MSHEPIDPEATTDDLEELSSNQDDAWLLELLPDGRLEVSSPEALALLHRRLERAELLRTGPGWTLMRSLQADLPDEIPPETEVVCSGVLGESGLSLIDFIGFLANACQTGVLSVASLDSRRSVYVHEGDEVWASSTAPEERLGEFLLRRGKITREQLQTAMRRGQTRIGRACVECGFLAAHELWTMVQAQLTEVFDQMLRTEQGMWFFSRISSEALSESKIHLSTQGLLMDALRRLDEMKVYRQRIRSSQTLVQRTTLRQTGNTDDVLRSIKGLDQEEAQALLRQLPRSATIQELMRYLGRGEFDVTRLAYQLLRAGLVELVDLEPAAVAPRPAQQVNVAEARDVINVYSMALREMMQDARQLGTGAALVESAAAFSAEPPEPHAHVLSAVVLREDGTLEEEPLLLAATRQGISSQELSDALSELLFFVLFQVTDQLGHKRGDSLARRVKVILTLLTKETAPA